MQRFFWPLTVLLLIVLGAVEITSMCRESQTIDESVHLAAGYSFLKTGVYWIAPEHPPLIRAFCALPLLALNPQLAVDDETYRNRLPGHFGKKFLYSNRVPADTMLFATRAMTVVLTLLLGLAIAFWCKKQFGAAIALLALLLFCFDPNITAHGRYVTTDIGVTLFFFLSCIAWSAYLMTSRMRDLLVSGLVLGLALASKFSAVWLLPLFIILYAVRCWQQGAFPLRAGIQSFAILAALAFVAVYATYAFETRPLISARTSVNAGLSLADKIKAKGEGAAGISRTLVRHPAVARGLDFLTRRMPVPAAPYFTGLYQIALHDTGGHLSYLLGHVSPTGWWYYFPVAFAVKTPTASLLLLCAALVIAFIRISTVSIRKVRFVWFVVILPPVYYFAIAMTSNIDIGYRHILPVLPFVFVFIAATLLTSHWRYRIWFKSLIAVSTIVLIAEYVRIYPHYLAFFNAVSGGSGNGARYLVDSNLDWGQDLKNLGSWLRQRNISNVCLSYFGIPDPEYYGIQSRPIPARPALDCVAAISATSLYLLDPAHAWMRQFQPVDKIGYSIFVYDFRRYSPARSTFKTSATGPSSP